MTIVDVERLTDIKKVSLHLDINEAKQLRDELDKLLQNPEARLTVYVRNESGQISCNLRVTEKQFLEDLKKYLKGVSLKWRKWEQVETWDHDHCAFCFKVFMDVKKYAENLKKSQKKPQNEQQDKVELSQEGYATEGNRHWICKECYEKHKDEFQFKVIN